MSSKFRFIFKPVEAKDLSLIHEWLLQPHIAEWIHGMGLQNTLKGLEKFCQGQSNTTYWIAYDKDIPFSFLITSPEGNDAITLDLFICDLDYMGKGIAVPMIREFLISQFPNVKRVLIDPEATNKRAIHVYQKVGFKIIGKFIASWHPVLHYQMELSMSYIYSHDMQQQLKDSVELLKMILGPDLLGVYLYGSSLVGGLQKYSDIDLFVVTNRATTSEEKAKLITNLLQISGIYMKSSKLPIEMTLVEKSKINPWQYPPHFDFQYGDWLRESFEKGIIEPWESYEMPDLAIIVTQVLLKSETLLGIKPEQLLPVVPYHDFMKAMLHDLNRLAADLEHDTRNVLLTFARIWSTLATDTIRSKPAAAEWVMKHLSEKHQPVIKRAKSICMGIENEYWADIKVLIKPCADFMMDKIKAQIPLVNFDDPSKRIKLFEDR